MVLLFPQSIDMATGPPHHVVGGGHGVPQPALDLRQALDDARREALIDVGHTRQRGRHDSPGTSGTRTGRRRGTDCVHGELVSSPGSAQPQCGGAWLRLPSLPGAGAEQC